MFSTVVIHRERGRMSRPRGWLCSPLEAEAATLAHWLRPEADRLATLIAWEVYGFRDALWEIHVAAHALAEKARMECDHRAIAGRALREAIGRREGADDRAFRAMLEAAERALRDSGRRADAAEAAGGVALRLNPTPPAELLIRAVEVAARRHRWNRRAHA